MNKIEADATNMKPECGECLVTTSTKEAQRSRRNIKKTWCALWFLSGLCDQALFYISILPEY